VPGIRGFWESSGTHEKERRRRDEVFIKRSIRRGKSAPNRTSTFSACESIIMAQSADTENRRLISEGEK
jgi:hypothetical protein